MKVISLFVCFGIGGIVVEILGARPKRVTGGTEISIEQAPYIVSLRRNGHHVCCGAFISTQHILTAAYCVFNETIGPHYDIRVVSGTDKIDETGFGRSIKNIFLPNGFLEGRFWHDVAVITLLEHVEWNEKENEIALPNAEQPCPEYATLTGFRVRPGKYGMPGLQQLRVRIRPFNPYNDTHIYNQIFHGTVSSRTGTLTTPDCGAPLVRDGRVVGVASVKSAKWHRSSYFVNVMKFETFIKQSMEIETSSSSASSFEFPSWTNRRRH